MPKCKKRHVEVIADPYADDTDKPVLKVICGNCQQWLTASAEGWYVIDYALIQH